MLNKTLNKTILALVTATILLPTLAMAKDHNSQPINYTGPAISVTSVAENIASVGHFSEKKVVLEGRLIHQISVDKFMFADDSGQVIAELDDDITLPTAINETSKVRIFGEFEGGSTPEVEVDYIKLL